MLFLLAALVPFFVIAFFFWYALFRAGTTMADWLKPLAGDKA